MTHNNDRKASAMNITVNETDPVTKSIQQICFRSLPAAILAC